MPHLHDSQQTQTIRYRKCQMELSHGCRTKNSLSLMFKQQAASAICELARRHIVQQWGLFETLPEPGFFPFIRYTVTPFASSVSFVCVARFLSPVTTNPGNNSIRNQAQRENRRIDTPWKRRKRMRATAFFSIRMKYGARKKNHKNLNASVARTQPVYLGTAYAVCPIQ